MSRIDLQRFERAFAVACVVAGGCAIALATLVPLPGQATASADTAFFCFPCGELGGLDIVVNILLFVPFALGLRLLRIRWLHVIGLAALASGTIELLQAFVIPGRDAGMSDVISNTIGGGLGAAVGGLWWRILLPGRRHAQALAWAGAGLVVIVMASSAYFLRPSWPATPWWGQWQPLHLHTARFQGKLIDARIAGLPIPAESLRQAPRIREALRSGAPLETTVITAGSTATIAPILRLAFDDNEVAMVSQSHDDLVLRIRLHTADALLQTPSVRLPGGLSDASGDTVRIASSYFENRYQISVAGPQGVREGSGTMHPTFGWAMLLPFEYPLGPDARWLAALWVAGLLLPVGYWAALACAGGSRWRARVSALVPPAVTIVVALAIVPIAFGFEVAGGPQFLGAIIGACIGALAAMIVARVVVTIGNAETLPSEVDPAAGATSFARDGRPASEWLQRRSPEYERR